MRRQPSRATRARQEPARVRRRRRRRRARRRLVLLEGRAPSRRGHARVEAGGHRLRAARAEDARPRAARAVLPLDDRAVARRSAVAAAHPLRRSCASRSSRSSRSASRASRAPRRRRRSAPSTSSTSPSPSRTRRSRTRAPRSRRASTEKPADALVRVITFAKRPRVVPIADDAKEAPALERHDIDADGPPPTRRAPQAHRPRRRDRPRERDAARLRPVPVGVPAPRGHPLRRRADRRRHPRRGEPRARLRREDLHRSRTTARCPGEVALRDLRVPDKVRVGEPFNLHANIFSSRPQKVRATLKQGEAINGLDGIRTLDLKPGDNDVTFKSVVRVAGEVTYALDLADIPEDRFKENNRFAVSVAVPGRPTVLYVEGNPARASYLASRALGAGVRRRHARPARDPVVDPRARALRLRDPLRRARRGASRSRSRTRSRATSAISAAASSSPAARRATASAAGTTPRSSESSRSAWTPRSVATSRRSPWCSSSTAPAR